MKKSRGEVFLNRVSAPGLVSAFSYVNCSVWCSGWLFFISKTLKVKLN